jgi:hypothetical protein
MKSLNAIRRILTLLLILPLGMIVYVYLFPNWQLDHPNLEFPFIIFGIPIVVLNFFLWFHPEFFQAYFHLVEAPVGVPDKQFTAALNLAGVLTALMLIGVGTLSLISGTNTPSTLETPATQMADIADFPASTQLPAAKLPSSGFASTESSPLTTESGETSVVSAPTQATAVAQIPISGGEATSTPTPLGAVAKIVSPTVKPTNTPMPSGGCAPATSEYLDAIREDLVDIGLNYTIETGSAIRSNEAENLWFVAAKIYGDAIDSGGTLPGVWGLFVNSDGYIDIYAINDTAQEYTYTAWGEDSDPVLSMESDGAQSAYNCAVNGN